MSSSPHCPEPRLGSGLALLGRPLFGWLIAAGLGVTNGAHAQPASPPASAAAAATPPAGSVGGMGDVNIYPKRLVIDDRNRLATIGLYNRSASPGEYDIAVGDKLMTPEGNLLEFDAVTDPAARARLRSAAAMLRWSPRRVALGGSEAQTVRVMVRVPPGLAPGEYRSHFTIVSAPPAADALSIDSATGTAPSQGIGVRIVPRFGISIPVIVRVGETTLAVGLKDLALGEGPAGRTINLTITRAGTRSAFGDIRITMAGSKVPVAEVLGVGVYTEVDSRSVQVPLNPKADPRLLVRGARLTATYTDDDTAPGKVLAKQDFVLP
ncbi:hypothetical protein ACFOON_11455 [Novosphingobium piscinae]|uniref:Molecular chaperone n=1 Tax=Novosphingobium piscinae TaxID=1507448 RepID=A0A7X1FXI1_9SPHN|nr:hypothetical protein [Novosphingobium piscinae]MBC2668167.1 hypothetical protein [Novosphingobium piscinae]